MNPVSAVFDSITDPRVVRTKDYPVGEMMLVILYAALCGVESWRGIEDFGEDCVEWFRKYLPFKNGIPSHQTYGRVMSLLKPS